jgi:hypothetical protein
MRAYLRLLCRRWRNYWKNIDYIWKGSEEE